MYLQFVSQFSTMYSKLCENIGIFIKNYKSINPGSNKVVFGPCEQDSEEKKILTFLFSIVKNRTFVKKIIVQKKFNFFIILLCISKEAS